MNQDIIFMPLGGGQRVGASCYYLRIGQCNIILDAGIGKENGMEFNPNFYSLVTSPFIQSMNQINHIFISHAHMDHIGYLLKLMMQSSYSNVYMTEITKVLAELQLYDSVFVKNKIKDEDMRLAVKNLLEKVAVVTYMQTIDFEEYKVTFYPAGHIPGAMMMLFTVGKRKILYTGDYSFDSTALTSGCIFPDDSDIDIAIICGLHAKHPEYTRKADALFKTVSYVLHSVETSGQSVMCHIPQLSKGVEFLKALNNRNTKRIPIYLDNSIMKMVTKMEQLSVSILKPDNKVIGDRWPREPHIYLTSNMNSNGVGFYHDVKIDFSLHEDFSEIKRFIKRINPKQAILVHCGKENSPFDNTIEQEMMLDGECKTQFIFAEEKIMYKL